MKPETTSPPHQWRVPAKTVAHINDAKCLESVGYRHAIGEELPIAKAPNSGHSVCQVRIPGGAIGLASAAMNLAEPNAGVLLDFAGLPFHGLAAASANQREVDILPYAFAVGDWGIMYAADAATGPSIEKLRASGLLIAVVGELIEEPGLFLRRGDTFRLSVIENEHFRHRMEDEGDYFAAHERSITLAPRAG